MAVAEKRTLSIEAKLHDHMTRPLSAMERSLRAFALNGAAAMKGAVGSILSLKTAVIGLAGAWGGLAVIGKIRSFGEQADQLLKLADSLGDTVENLSELQAAFELAGVKSDGFAALLRALVNAEKQALGGNEDMVEAFEALGLTLRDLQTLGPSQVFERVAQGLEQFSDKQERAIALSKILPRQFLELLPILGKGIDQFQTAIVDARQAGATVTRQQAEVAERLNDSFTKLQIAMRGVSLAMIEAFGPKTIAILERLAKEITANRDGILEVAEAIGKGIVGAVNLALDALIGFVSFLEDLPFVSLIKEDKVHAELNVILRDLELLEEARDRVATKRIVELFPNGRPSAFNASARKVFDELVEVQKKAAADRERILDTFAPREGEMKSRIESLTRILQDGLAGEMQAMREKLARELESAASSIGATKAHTPDETAAALGMPSTEDWAAYADAFGAAMKERAEARKNELKSVFAAPAGAGAQNAISEILDFDDLTRETRDFVAELAKVVPGLDAVRLKLIDTQLAADTLKLEKLGTQGVLSARELAAALEFLKKKAEEAKGKVVELENSVSGGLGRSLEGLEQSLKNFSTTIGQSLGELALQSIDSFSNSIADVITGAKDAKEAFKDFAKQFLSDVARMISKMLVLAAIKSIFGLEDGGVVDGKEDGGVVRRFASGGVNRSGGIARRPTLLFGEGKTAEAFVPLPDNRTIPVTLNGGGGGNVFNFNIHAIDGRDAGRMLYEQQGTLRSILTNQIETRNGMRQVIRRAAL